VTVTFRLGNSAETGIEEKRSMPVSKIVIPGFGIADSIQVLEN
jgi:hypothetical protein